MNSHDLQPLLRRLPEIERTRMTPKKKPAKAKSKKSAGPQIFDAVAKRRFGKTICFLCGCKLTPKNRTDEHVIPKWLQATYNLWNHKLVLLNRTEIPYKSLTIPACKDCNGKYLAPIESRVQRAVEQGAPAVRTLDKHILFFWLGKLLYGLLYREHLLRRNRSSRSKRMIVPREVLRRFRLHHYFLQGCRVPIKFEIFFPASIWIVDTQVPPDVEYQFDFRDAPFPLLLAIRMGSVGIIAALQDGGALDGDESVYGSFAFHPQQFTELVAQFFYKSSTLNRTPKFMITEQAGTIHVVQPGLAGLSLKPVFDPWIAADYAKILAEFQRVPFEAVFVPPDRARTIIRNERGQLNYMDLTRFSA